MGAVAFPLGASSRCFPGTGQFRQENLASRIPGKTGEHVGVCRGKCMEGNEFWRLETPKTVSLSVCSSIHVKCSQHDGSPSGKGRGPSFRVLFQSANIPLWSIGKGSHRSEALCSHLQVGRSPHRPLCMACAALSRLLGLLYTERPQGAWEEKSHREQWHGLYGTGSQNTSCTFWVLCTTKPRAKRGVPVAQGK